MADLIRLPMVDIWSESGDIQAPDSTKIKAGWGVEVVPRQWWNWMQNRVDNNVAYVLQKGIPEWDAVTDYYANKSYVQTGGIVYKATASGTNRPPASNPTYWTRAFADYSVSMNALRAVTPSTNGVPYFNSTTTATTANSSAFGRGMWSIADAAAGRNYINAQTASSNLTALSGVGPATNALPYFNSTTTMETTLLTQYGRALIGSADAGAARTTLGLKGGAITDVSTTNNPTTAGLLLKVGDYGWGAGSNGLGAMLAPSGDLNLATLSGSYRVQGSDTGAPSGYGQGAMLLSLMWNNATGDQFITQNGKFAVRGGSGLNGSSPTWTDWAEGWTSLNLVKTASQTDTTAGSMLKVCDFGIGCVNNAPLANDANAVQASGKYGTNNASTISNYPVAVNGMLDHSTWVGGGAASQTFITTSEGAGRFFWRSKTSDVWQAWKESAPLASPNFSGTPTAPTQGNGVSNTSLATTAFVNNYTDQYGIGSSTAPSVSGNETTRKSGNYYFAPGTSNYPDFAFVMRHTFSTNKGFEVANIPYSDRLFLRATNSDGTWRAPVEMAKKSDLDGLGGDVSQKADINSPTFTGSPKAPTAGTGTNSTQLATTAFVQNSKRNYANYILGVSSDITMTVANSAIVWQFNAVCTVTLPTASSTPAGTTFNFRVPTGKGGSKIVHSGGIISEVNSNTLTLADGEWIEFVNNNTSWYVSGRGNIETVATKSQLDSLLNNAALTGIPTAPKAAVNSNSVSVATTSFVQQELNYWGLGTSTPRQLSDMNAGTQGGSYSSSSASNAPLSGLGVFDVLGYDNPGCVQRFTSLSTSAPRSFVRGRVGNSWGSWFEMARTVDISNALVNTSLTGTPTAPTQAQSDNTTKLATTAYVRTAVSNALAVVPARATTADRWTTARTITLTGDVTGSVSMDGSGNVSIGTTLQSANLGNYYTKDQSDVRFAISGAAGKNYFLKVDNGTVPTMSAATADYSSNGLRISNDSNNSAIAAMSFVREGQFGTFFGLDTDNNLAMGGWSNGNRRYLIWTEKNFSINAQIASQTTGDVGTYGLFMLGGGGGINPGDLVSGGNMRYSSTGGHTTTSATVYGTWKIMGYVAAANFGGVGATTVCMRVS